MLHTNLLKLAWSRWRWSIITSNIFVLSWLSSAQTVEEGARKEPNIAWHCTLILLLFSEEIVINFFLFSVFIFILHTSTIKFSLVFSCHTFEILWSMLQSIIQKISGDIVLLYLCGSSPLFSFKVRHNKNVPNLLITTIKREDGDQNNFHVWRK